MSTLHRSCPSRIDVQPISHASSLKITWRVRAGSIQEPTCETWLRNRVSPDASVMLATSVSEEEASFRFVTPAGETLDLSPILAAASLEILSVFTSQDDAGFTHAEVTGRHNGANIVLLRASRLTNAASKPDTRRSIATPYAVMQLWTLLQVPGGRYELVGE